MIRSLILCLGMVAAVACAAAAGAPGLTSADRDDLRRYARQTWYSVATMARPSGLPADSLKIGGDGRAKPSERTSPTDIAAYLWSTLAAERLGLITTDEADDRLGRTVAAFGRLERHRGFFLIGYDPRTGNIAPGGKLRQRPPHFLSSVDNGWLAAALIMVRNARPALRDRAEALLGPMDFGFFYEPFDASDPTKHPGQLHGGYCIDDGSFTTPYGLINTEPRIASYVAITRGQVPPEHYYRIFRTLPAATAQQARPEGEWRVYLGVPLFEGHYTIRSIRVVPSWGGSMFEALMVPLFVPEASWAPRSWGINHPLYVRLQIEYGLAVRRYGAWGFSPAADPAGGYRTYGVDAIGSQPKGYYSFDPGAGRQAEVPPSGPVRDGVVTPHASFLALPFAPRDAMDNLHTLERRFPKIYGSLGFRDSVDVTTGAVADQVLALDQGMILAAIANALRDDAMQHLFSDGDVERTVRPLIAPEQFTAGGKP